jgi:Mg-chelatase subunit ChlD
MSCPNCGCQELNAYVLLDRSGSMASRWSEALGSINAYVKELAKGSAKVTLATFDTVDTLKFDVLRDAVPAGDWKDVTDQDAVPRGGTPLFDALIRAVSLAESANSGKTVLVVMTDGAENTSREATKATAKAAIDRCKSKGWEVIFLGADFNAFGEASSVGVGFSKVMSMSAGNYVQTMSDLGAKSRAYVEANAAIDFTDEDRLVATGGGSK